MIKTGRQRKWNGDEEKPRVLWVRTEQSKKNQTMNRRKKREEVNKEVIDAVTTRRAWNVHIVYDVLKEYFHSYGVFGRVLLKKEPRPMRERDWSRKLIL